MTEEEYLAAMARIDEIFEAEEGTAEAVELEGLVCKVMAYENGLLDD